MVQPRTNRLASNSRSKLFSGLRKWGKVSRGLRRFGWPTCKSQG